MQPKPGSFCPGSERTDLTSSHMNITLHSQRQQPLFELHLNVVNHRVSHLATQEIIQITLVKYIPLEPASIQKGGSGAFADLGTRKATLRRHASILKGQEIAVRSTIK